MCAHCANPSPLSATLPMTTLLSATLLSASADCHSVHRYGRVVRQVWANRYLQPAYPHYGLSATLVTATILTLLTATLHMIVYSAACCSTHCYSAQPATLFTATGVS